MARPQPGDYGSFYQGYADLAKGDDVSSLLKNYPSQIELFITSIPNEKADFQYAEGKWTIKQLLQHMIDAERIFAYRALRISRNDQTALPGFDENHYAENAPIAHRSLETLKEEFLLVRKTTDLLFNSFTDTQLKLIGNASGNPVTVNALCFILFGHNLHHINILRDRYLN